MEAPSHKTGDNNFCCNFLLLLLLVLVPSLFSCIFIGSSQNIDLDFGHTFNSMFFKVVCMCVRVSSFHFLLLSFSSSLPPLLLF